MYCCVVHKVTLAGLAAAVMTGVVAAAATMFFGPGPAGAIVNGRNAEPGQFSFPVKLTMTNVPRSDGTTYGSACSAALISPQWIVIAGHCFHDVNRNPVSGRPRYKTTATIGVANLGDSHAITVAVVNVRQAGVNDIALAKLAEPVTGVSTLAIADRAPAAGQELTIAGWGATGSVDPTPSTQLRYGKVAVSSVTSTTVLVHGVWPQADTGACTYDSGAPYFTGNTLVAVESTGPDCPHTSDETTSRVDVVAHWISNQLARG